MGNSVGDSINSGLIAWTFVYRDLEACGVMSGPPDAGDEHQLAWTHYSARCSRGAPMPTPGLCEISAASRRPYLRAGRTAPRFLLVTVDPLADSVSVRLIDLADAIDAYARRTRLARVPDELAA